eukprot:21314-Eustigmatos_ZCMA.PRE.1
MVIRDRVVAVYVDGTAAGTPGSSQPANDALVMQFMTPLRQLRSSETPALLEGHARCIPRGCGGVSGRGGG